MEMKRSKFEWFDSIPENWNESKISYLFEIGRGRVISAQELKEDGKYPVYSSQTKDNGCMGMIDTYDFDDNLITWTTDGANAGTVFIRNGKFNCTNVCGTLKSINALDLKFYFYYLQFCTQFYKRPDTNGAKIMNNEMANIHALVPPIETQTRIAEFLDKKTTEIDSIIEKKEKLLELLEEKKKAVINEAVTKGLNPNASFKNVNLEWLEKVPNSWKVSKLKWLSNIFSGGTPSTEREDFWEKGTIPWLNSGSVNDRIISRSSNFITKLGFENSSAKWIPSKSILIALAGQGKTRGTVAKLEFESTCNQSLGAIVPNHNDLDYNFLYYWLDTNYINIRSLSGLDKRDGLNLQMVGDIVVPLPTINEQLEISAYLSEFDKKVQFLQNKLEIQILKLKEYRQSIISEAVTGKLEI